MVVLGKKMPETGNNKLSAAFIWAWMTALVVIAAYIRVGGAGIYHYHVDELMHIKIAEGDTLKQVLQFSLFETHPPLGHILRHYWLKVSEETWFVRSLSLIFGIAL